MEVLEENFEEAKTLKNFDENGPKYNPGIKPNFNKVQKNSISELHQKLKAKNRKL